MNPEEPDDELDIPDEPDNADEVRRRAGWPTAGPGRPGPGEMAYLRAFDLSLAKWRSGNSHEEGIGSVRWVRQKLNEEGYGLKPFSTVQRWIRRGEQIRTPELEWARGPLQNRDKLNHHYHGMLDRVDDEYEAGKISDETVKMITLKSQVMKQLAELNGAKAAALTAIEITQRAPAGMSEKDVATLRSGDPAALTDAERRDMLAGYDTRRRNGSGADGAGSGHDDPDGHG